MQFRSHRGSKKHYMAEHLVHGDLVGALIACAVDQPGAVPDTHAGLCKAHDVMADLHVGGERVQAGGAVEPIEFADHEIMACGWGGQWIATTIVGGEGIYLRCRADDEAHARRKLGVMMAHLHAGDTHANASARVAARAAKAAAIAALPAP